MLRVVPPATLGEGPLTFEQIYRRYARYVAAVVLRLDPAVSDLDDVVQDVFLAAASGLGRLRDQTATKAWLATVAVRITRRRLRVRRMWRWFGIGEDDRPPPPLVDAGSHPLDRLLLGRVYQVLDGMAVDDRVAFVLHCIEGETLEAVARICRCSLATTTCPPPEISGRPNCANLADACSTTTKTCVPRAAVGESCVGGAICVRTAYCDGSICGAQKGPGEVCTNIVAGQPGEKQCAGDLTCIQATGTADSTCIPPPSADPCPPPA